MSSYIQSYLTDHKSCDKKSPLAYLQEICQGAMEPSGENQARNPLQPIGCPASFLTNSPGATRSKRLPLQASKTMPLTMIATPSWGSGRPSTSPKVVVKQGIPAIEPAGVLVAATRATIPLGGKVRLEVVSLIACGVALMMVFMVATFYPSFCLGDLGGDGFKVRYPTRSQNDLETPIVQFLRG